MRGNHIFLVLLIFLAGCATGYHSLGYTGGFSDVQLSQNSFKISFTGNGHTLQNRAVDFALLRSADLTIRHGFKYFVIDAIEEHTRNTFVANAYGATTVSRPRVNLVIICFHEKPVVSGKRTYEARFLSASIRRRYGITPLSSEPVLPEIANDGAGRKSEKLQSSSPDADAFIMSLIHHSGPRPLRRFIESYRNLYTSNGKQFFSDLLSSKWYSTFKTDHHRNPVIAIIDQRKQGSSPTPPRHVWIPINGGINFYFVPQPWANRDFIQEQLLKTGMVGIVIYQHRKFSSDERFFQMKHAASRYIKLPGHLEGADAVLLLSERNSQEQPLGFRPEDMTLPVEIANVTTVSVDFKLIDIGTDALLWTRTYPLDVQVNRTFCRPPSPGLKGIPTFANSCYSEE